MENAWKVNTQVWEDIYAQNKSMLQYPESTLVSLSYHILDPSKHKKILDYGFGAGANALFLLKRGFEVSGVEVSETAVRVVSERIRREGFNSDFKLMKNGIIDHPDNTFDAVIPWGVLCYNNWETLPKSMKEIERVLRPGGLFIGTMAASGDISEEQGAKIEDGIFRSKVKAQEGAIRMVV
ncbi:MAG: class I SAM-dependent methyltransferase, partial [Candidatus Omnitrophica bacterium]|nr:class I SAM-dependent methyltransferase [Candidatus Omnitrophota bacterium]